MTESYEVYTVSPVVFLPTLSSGSFILSSAMDYSVPRTVGVNVYMPAGRP
jgi:hypothetical protein